MRSRILLIFDVFRALFHVRGFQMETGESELRAFLLADDGRWPEVKLINRSINQFEHVRRERPRGKTSSYIVDILQAR